MWGHKKPVLRPRHKAATTKLGAGNTKGEKSSHCTQPSHKLNNTNNITQAAVFGNCCKSFMEPPRPLQP
jgi:hypothetical protein